MNALVAFAFVRDRFVALLTVLLLAAGGYAYLGFPSQEEPTLPVNAVVIQAQNAGLDAARMEQLVTRPIERRLRELREAKNIISTTRAGLSLIRLEIQDATLSYDLAWQRVREKMADAKSDLPAGTTGPTVNDDFGRVAVATIALTAPSAPWRQFRSEVERLRDRLTAFPGVEGVTLHGLSPERIRIDIQPALQSQIAGSIPDIIRQIEQRNVAVAAGHVAIGRVELVVDPQGAFADLEAIANLAVTVPGAIARLGDFARIERVPVDPLQVAAFHNGERAIILAVSMQPGLDVTSFNKRLLTEVWKQGAQLPAGYRIAPVTDQGAVTADVIGDMTTNLLQTVAVILLVTVIALGWRGGMVVGLLVPITMLISLLLIRALGIELNIVTTAAYIIALGILVDNGNVVVDETERRIREGLLPREAALTAAGKLGAPLLVATAATAFAFLPPMFTSNIAATYMKILTIVMVVTLAVSWLVSVTVAPLMASTMLKPAALPQVGENKARSSSTVRSAFAMIVAWPKTALLAVLIVFVGMLGLSSRIPAGFLPSSERAQFQISVEAPAGSSANNVAEQVVALQRWLLDGQARPGIASATAYIGEGGPRFILGLNPPDPAPNRAYVIVNVKTKADLAPTTGELHRSLGAAFPDFRFEVKPFSLGSTEAGQAVVRISAQSEQVLRAAADRIKSAMRTQPGVIDVRDDWETRVFRLALEPREAAMRQAGVTIQQVMAAAAGVTVGAPVSTLRDRDQQIPIVLRTHGGADAIEKLLDARIATPNGAVALSELVDLSLLPEPSVIHKRNLYPTITVTGRNPAWTAQELVDRIGPALKELPAEVRIGLGGEIEENETATAAIFAALPACLLAIVMLFVLQFNSIRKVAIILLTIPFCAAGIIVTLVALQAPFDFMSNLGIFALIGTIISNAILIFEQVDEEEEASPSFEEAIVSACAKRFRPIVVTQATTILGLLPLLLSFEPLWYSFNLVVMGGLTAGTVGSLIVVPALLRLMFPKGTPLAQQDWKAEQQPPVMKPIVTVRA